MIDILWRQRISCAQYLLAVVGMFLWICGVQAQECESAFSGDRAKGQAIATRQCASCHGAQGISNSAQFPNLAGQLPEYLLKQLKAFKAPPQGKPLRMNEVMTPLVSGLTETDFQDLAAYFSALSAPLGATRDVARLELGRQIYTQGNPSNDLPACITCHRPTGNGIRPDFPRLAGQRPDYLEHQLETWMAVRAKPGKLMTMIVPHLRPDERAAVADYVAQLH